SGRRRLREEGCELLGKRPARGTATDARAASAQPNRRNWRRIHEVRVPPPLLAGLLAAFALACAHPRQATPHGQVASLAAAPAPRLVRRPPVPPPPPPRADFAPQAPPILAAPCQPCHFAGGTMYDRLPFDRTETILQLREKLFTRIKDEDEQRTIRA